MGFGTLSTNIIMFIAVISMTTGFIGIFKMYVDESASSMQIQSKVIANNIKTDITFQVVSFDNMTESTTATILNTGKTKLDIDYVDVYVDSLMVPRNDGNRTIQISPTTEIENPGIWDPREVLEVVVYKNLTKGTHSIKIATEYGVVDTYSYSN